MPSSVPTLGALLRGVRNREGWTIVLASVPKAKGGRDAALPLAQQARSRSLPRVGVLDPRLDTFKGRA